jgi:hypothetical protein
MRAEARSWELKQFIFKIYKRSFQQNYKFRFHLILSVKEIYLCSLSKFSTIKMLQVQNIIRLYAEK